MTWIATAIAGTAVIGGTVGLITGNNAANAATNAANTQAAATDRATNTQYQEFLAQQSLMQPFVDSGTKNLNALNTAVSPGGQLDPSKRFTMADWQNSPEYAAYGNALASAGTQSTNALKASAAAGGNYGGGSMANQLQANLAQLGMQYQPASLAAAQANWNAGNTQQFNQMSALANPNAAQQVANYAGQYGANAGANTIAGGNALANGMNSAAGYHANGLTNATNQAMSGLGAFNQNALYQNSLGNSGGLFDSTNTPDLTQYNTLKFD